MSLFRIEYSFMLKYSQIYSTIDDESIACNMCIHTRKYDE